MVTVLFDADSFIYEYALTNTDVTDWGDGVESVALDERGARDALRTRFAEIQDELGANNVIVALTDYDHQNFRKAVYPGYKARRHEKPALVYLLRKFCQDTYLTYIRPHLEADDICGILGTHPTLIKGEKIVVSIDKDMNSLPITLFNPDKDRKPRKISVRDADRFFFTQTLTGDRVDDYPGCPGIGIKRAEKALEGEFGATWENVVKVYESKGLTEADALVQARCARILRHTDYDFKKKGVILWQP